MKKFILLLTAMVWIMTGFSQSKPTNAEFKPLISPNNISHYYDGLNKDPWSFSSYSGWVKYATAKKTRGMVDSLALTKPNYSDIVNFVSAASSFGSANLLLKSADTGRGSTASGISVDGSNNMIGVGQITMGNRITYPSTLDAYRQGDGYNIFNLRGTASYPGRMVIYNAGNSTISAFISQSGYGDSYITSPLWVGGYTTDPGTGNKFAVNGNTYINGYLGIKVASPTAPLQVAYESNALDAVNPLVVGSYTTGANKTGLYNKIYSASPFGGGLILRTYKRNVGALDAITIDDSGASTFSSSVTATAFIKTGGTSAQYLLADGSVTTVAGSVYKGEINGSTGSGLADGTGTNGWYYACSVAGTHNYGSGNITLAVGDQLYYNGSVWLKIPGAGSYTLPVATASTLGGIKPSSSVFVSEDGTATVSTNYDASGTASSLLASHAALSDAHPRDTRNQIAGNYESPLTFSTGLSRTGNTITNTITQYTDVMARGALSSVSGSSGYNSTTGVISIPSKTSQLTNDAGFIAAESQTLTAGGTTSPTITLTGSTPITFVAGGYTSLMRSGNTITITSDGDGNSGGMVYPGAGIPLSTGTGWGTSITNNSTAWNQAVSDKGKVYIGATLTNGLSSQYFSIDGSSNAKLITAASISALEYYNPPTGAQVYNALQNYSLTTHNHSGVYEPVLGNPSSSGYVLSSTSAGVRSWVPLNTSIPIASSTVVGGFQIGTAAPAATALPIQLYTSGANNYGYVNVTKAAVEGAFNGSATTSHTHSYLPLSGGTLTGGLTGTTATFSGLVTGSNFQLSDRRLKTQIRPIKQSVLKDISKINFYQYRKKNDLSLLHFGPIAQEVEKYMPDLVHTDSTGVKSVNYIELLVAKIADLEKRVKELEDEE